MSTLYIILLVIVSLYIILHIIMMAAFNFRVVSNSSYIPLQNLILNNNPYIEDNRIKLRDRDRSLFRFLYFEFSVQFILFAFIERDIEDKESMWLVPKWSKHYKLMIRTRKIIKEKQKFNNPKYYKL